MTSLFRNASIGLKVSLAPAFAIVCLLVVAFVGWFANVGMTDDLHRVRAAMGGVAGAQDFATRLGDLHQGMYQTLAWEAVGQRDDKIKALDERLLKDMDAFSKSVKALLQSPDLHPSAREGVSTFDKEFDKYRKVARDTLDIKSAGVATAASYVVTLDQQYQVCQGITRKFVADQVATGDAVIAGAREVSVRNGVLIVGTAALAVALAAGLAWMFTRAITRPLAQAAQAAQALAQGDLTAHAEPTSDDATGRVLGALQEVSHRLGGLVDEIRATAHQISTSSGEIASGNADLSARTENTASALQQTAASIEELAATIKNSAAHASEANRLARSASAVADEGGAVVAEVVSTMEAINAQAKKIGEIIGTIDGIAFQTNILALNAAVEAARAGEHGRGFSVVAQEVRTLAQRSAEAAREIRSLISSSVEQIDAGTGKVQQAGVTMGRIVESIQRVTATVDSIARAAGEQASGIEQINVAVAEMDRSTQQNAAMVEQAAAATDSLRSQAGSLVQMLSRFRTAA